MQSDFNPIHLQKANDILSKDLNKVKKNANLNAVYKKEIFGHRTLWEKFLDLLKK